MSQQSLRTLHLERFIYLYSTTYLDAIDPDLSRLVGPRGSFTFRAITVIPMNLLDELFDYEVLLAEGK
ncbi:MAG: hypothetical protein EA362_13525 [Saprospirales bacterium]|nr:MAG: hypothetical protein EA362_13525 [Saprospirales bacterium]